MKLTKKLIAFFMLIVAIALSATIVLGVAPMLAIPNANVNEDAGLTQYDLHNFASDVEDADANLTFIVNSQSSTSAVNCVLNGNGHTLDCTTIANQAGANTVQITV
ncbi:MAG: hypothetical protein Q8R37_04040, partial [Nanoarchaeota archaeon]|nr:hypothetical protein [Nanoarchaeota archaeon]